MSPRCLTELSGVVSERHPAVEHLHWETGRSASVSILESEHSGIQLERMARDAVDLRFAGNTLRFRVTPGYPDTDIVIIETV